MILAFSSSAAFTAVTGGSRSAAADAEGAGATTGAAWLVAVGFLTLLIFRLKQFNHIPFRVLL